MNTFPTTPGTRRLAIILEAPALASPNEWDYTLDLLDKLLGHAGLSRASHFLGYICHTPTPHPERLKWASEKVQAGIKLLSEELRRYQPHMVLAFDRSGLVLRTFSGEKRAVDDWRGYVWRTTECFPGVKMLATYAPSRVRQEWGLTGVVRFDLQKAARELVNDELGVPARDVVWDGSKEEILAQLSLIRQFQTPVAVDIEGGCGMGPSCVGFADSPHHALVVPFYDVNGCSIWNEADEIELWEAVAGVLEDPAVPKIIQNALYELFVLAWTTGIVVHGLVDDTMVKGFELHCELEKSLEFLASIYTSQPYWKLEHRVVEGRYVPFKGGRRATTEEWMIYNGTDCCVTYEVNQVMEGRLKPQQREHYRWNVGLLVPLAYMSLRGIRYDAARAQERLTETVNQIYELQDEINREAAASRPALKTFYEAFQSTAESGDVAREDGDLVGVAPRQSDLVGDTAKLIPLLTAAFCQARRTEQREVEEVSWQPHRWNGKKWVKAGKRTVSCDGWIHSGAIEAEEAPEPTINCWLKPIRKLITRSVPVAVETLEDVERFTLGSKAEECKQAIKLLRGAAQNGGLCAAQRGELSTLLGISININSTSAGGDAQWYVFDHCGAPKQFIKEAGRNTTRLTTGNEAVLAAYIATQDSRLAAFMKWRSLDTRRESLVATADPDGRVRCGYNLPGTDTYRLSCYKSPTGSGYNLQTVTEGLRDLFPADEGCEFGQFDLKGADGWTIAAECVRCGDNTMLLDLQAGLKPVNIIVLLYTEGTHINQLTREELREAQKRVAKESWQYIATKPIFYGYAYLMGARKMSAGIAEDSYVETGVATVVSPRKCEEIMRMIDLRYPGIQRWQVASGHAMITEGVLRTTVGWQRHFHGRKTDVKNRSKPDRTTHGAWLGTLPQFNTTYATKMGLHNLWHDPENRRPDGSLRVEPLHTVHDSLNPQWRVEDREFARAKVLPVWFNTPFNVAGVEMVIPASGTYGVSWGAQPHVL